MRHIYILIVLFCLPLVSCKERPQTEENKGIKVIDVAGGVGKSRQINLSEIADSIEYIPLETNPESLLSFPPGRRILYENGIIYFVQKKSIFKIFDSNGKYLSTFNKVGRGPQEYETAGNIYIDNASGKMIIESIFKMAEYSLDGEFIRNIHLPKENGVNITGFILKCLKLGDNYFYLSGALSGYSVIIADSSSNVIKKIKYPLEELDFVRSQGRPFAHLEPYIYLYNDKIRLINGVNKYVLSINKDLSVDTVFIIDYGKYFPDDKKLRSRPSNNPLHLLSRYHHVFESDNYLFMRFYLGSFSNKPYKMLNPSGKEYTANYACALFNKETEEFTFLDQPEIYQIGFVDDLEGGPGIWPVYLSTDNYMISFVPAEELIAHAESHRVSEKLKTIAAGLKETDNYIFVRAKLK
jgi:hypothetical protein